MQNGENANIKNILNLETLSISIFKFIEYVEDKYIGVRKIKINKIFGKELFMLTNGAKILCIGKYALLVPFQGSKPWLIMAQ